MNTAISIAFLTLLLPASAIAAEADPSRFQLERSGDHFVRLDRQTGAMSVCEDKDGALACRMAADERAAYDEELNRLADRVTALEKSAAVKPNLPSDAEVDRTIGIMERMMRSFMGMVREFQGEEEKDKTLPQKTRAIYE
ncbi:hypothetical protein [Rhizobium sp. RAF56]|jgi:hypothetical protein|uniref:hypothetical protein n=1 Tax=Rhizobium sp. RAF56 TaxID=3233062 RepID=UPI003F9618F5